MRFKVDENLPAEHAALLRNAGYEADTVGDQDMTGVDDSALFARCQAEGRILLTLDLDFGNVQAYPPKSHSGIVVFRSTTQDKPALIALLQRLLPLFRQRSPSSNSGLWSTTAFAFARRNTNPPTVPGAPDTIPLRELFQQPALLGGFVQDVGR